MSDFGRLKDEEKGATSKLLSAILHVVPELKADEAIVADLLSDLSSNVPERSIPASSIEPLAAILSFLVEAEIGASKG